MLKVNCKHLVNDCDNVIDQIFPENQPVIQKEIKEIKVFQSPSGSKKHPNKKPSKSLGLQSDSSNSTIQGSLMNTDIKSNSNDNSDSSKNTKVPVLSFLNNLEFNNLEKVEESLSKRIRPPSPGNQKSVNLRNLYSNVLPKVDTHMEISTVEFNHVDVQTSIAKKKKNVKKRRASSTGMPARKSSLIPTPPIGQSHSCAESEKAVDEKVDLTYFYADFLNSQRAPLG